MTPPQSQRHSTKYGGMARGDHESPASPRTDSVLQTSTREEIDLYDDNDVEYYDFEDHQGAPGTSTTVKMSDRLARQQGHSQSPAPSKWEGASVPPLRPSSPAKPTAQARVPSQVVSPAQSRYAKSESANVPARSSATSSTAVSPSIPSTSAFSSAQVNRPIEQKSKPQPRRIDALEDIILPSLDEVRPFVYLR